MTQPLLGPGILRHPCEAAFDILLDARIDAHMLYLEVSADSSRHADISIVSWSYRHDTIAPGNKPDTDHVGVGQQRLDKSISLPIPEHAFDVLVLRIPEPQRLDEDALNILMGVSTRHLGDDGELFIICSTPPTTRRGLADARDSRNLSNGGRLFGTFRDLVNALWPSMRRKLARVLHAHGFHHTESFIPEYNASGEPARLSLLMHDRQIRQPISLRRWVHLRSQRDPALIRASRQGLRPSFFRLALKAVRESIGHTATADQQPAVIDAMLISPKEKVVVLGRVDKSGFVLRIPFTPEARDGCGQNMRALRSLQADPDLASIVPGPLLEAVIGTRYVSGESRVPGAPLRFLPLDENALRHVERLLYRLNTRSRLEEARLEREIYEELLEAPLAALAGFPDIGTHHEALKRFFAHNLRGSCVRLGLCHGDLSVRNIYMDAGRVSGVIDWDDGVARGLPVLDAIGHLVSRQSRRGNGLTDAVARLSARRWPVDYELDFLDRCYAYFDVVPAQHFPLVMLYWLQVVANQSRHWFARNDEFASRNISPIVRLILKNTQGTASIAEPVSPGS